MKRVWSFFMVFVLVLGLLPPITAEAKETATGGIVGSVAGYCNKDQNGYYIVPVGASREINVQGYFDAGTDIYGNGLLENRDITDECTFATL